MKSLMKEMKTEKRRGLRTEPCGDEEASARRFKRNKSVSCEENKDSRVLWELR